MAARAWLGRGRVWARIAAAAPGRTRCTRGPGYPAGSALASRSALVRAAQLDPDGAAAGGDGAADGRRFRQAASMAEIAAQARSAGTVAVADWAA